MKPAILIFLLCTASAVGQTFRFSRPVPDNIQVNGSYLYGEPKLGNSSLAHTGVDIDVKYDTVRAVANGTVSLVAYNPSDTIGGYEPSGCGNYLYLQTTWNGKTTNVLYCHLKKPIVAQGTAVSVGTPLAISGTTGNSTGPHLHLEIRVGSTSPGASRSRRNAELWMGMSGTGAIYGRVPNASNNTRVNITPDPKPRPPYTTYGYSLTYNFNDPAIGSDELYQENYAIGDVKPGTYTVSTTNGSYVRSVTVKAGEVVNADAPVVPVHTAAETPQRFVLEQNFPNPFNPATTIRYSLSTDGFVRLFIYDLLGREIVRLADSYHTAGSYSVLFTSAKTGEGGNCCPETKFLPSGMYLYRLAVTDEKGSVSVVQKKMMLLQ